MGLLLKNKHSDGFLVCASDLNKNMHSLFFIPVWLEAIFLFSSTGNISLRDVQFIIIFNS